MKVETLIQKHVYAGLLAGVPNKSMNKQIVNNAHKDALRNLGVDTKQMDFIQDYLKFPVIIEPKNKETSLIETKSGTREAESLPAYCTNIVYTDGLKSVLVIMFTNQVGNMNEINDIIAESKINLEDMAKEIDW